jgi:ribosomal protein L11 methyltransferase
VIRLALRVQRSHSELVLAELLELAPAGVEEASVGEQVVEYALYGAPGELPGLPDLRAAVGGALVEVSTSEVPDDWSERWREFHKPVVVEPPPHAASMRHAARTPRAAGAPHTASAPPTLRIRPPWEPALGARGAARVEEIVIDPAQAFGTGAHVTTQLCLELLLQLAGEGSRGPLLDVGTGSGVLAIAAARLGFAPVIALDNDKHSVEAARRNAAANAARIEVRGFDVRSGVLPWLAPGERPAGTLMLLANLLRPLLVELARAMPAAPAELIAGGLLRGEADEVASELARRHGMVERARREHGEWAALRLSAG